MTGSPPVSPPERRRLDRQVEVDEALTRLHGRQEHAAELSALHEEAAADFATTAEERRFHLTHAWVYALVLGDDDRSAALETELRRIGGLA